MRLVLLVNTSASSVTARGRVVIAKALSADHNVTVAETSRRGHAMRLAQGAASDGADVVVALGGDGTLNEAANGLAGTSCALGALPGGSTNVFARTIGFTNDPIEATGELLAALARPDGVRSVGLGSANGRYFLFHAGLGFDAAVVEQVERRAELKRWAGHALFVYAGLDTWLRHYDHRRPRLGVELADGTKIADAYLAVCLNTNPYTFLGDRPLDLAPRATLDRPLSLVVFRTLRFRTILGVVGSAMGIGRPLRSWRGVESHDDLRMFTVRACGDPLPYQLDGDYLGTATELVLRWEPDVLRLVVPGT